MKFRVMGGPLPSGVDIEAKHSDTFKTIFKKAQKAAGKKVSLEGYGLFTSVKEESSGKWKPGVGPVRSTETPETYQLDRKQKTPHVLWLRERGESGGDELGSTVHSLSRSNSLSHGGNGAGGDAGSVDATSSASATPVTTPRAEGSYRRRMLAMFLKYDREKVSRVDVALERYAGYEEDVLQQLVRRYGPEPAPGEVDTSPAAVMRVVAATGASISRGAASKRPNDGASYHDRLVAIYTTYEPEKLSKVEGTLRHYAGREEEVIQQLLKKYGPEPKISAAPQSVEVSPAPVQPPPPPTADGAADATPTTIDMSEAPSTTPGYELTPMVGTTTTTIGAADSLPVTPRNLQDDYGGGSSSGSKFAAAPPPSSSAAVDDRAPSSPTGPLTYRDRLTAMYATYDPSKVRLVDGTLKKYKGREEAVLKQLVKMYGPEPSPERVAAAKEEAARARHAREAAATAVAPAPFAPIVEEPASPAEAPAEEATPSLPAVEVETAPVAKPATPEAVVIVAVDPAVELSAAAAPVEASAPVETTALEAPASSPLSPPTDVPNVPEDEPEGDRYRERLVALYHTYNPSKLHTVEGTLRKFAGKEEAAIQQLVRRYGPEPPALTTAEALELLQSASGGSPLPSPRTQNPPSSGPVASTETAENVSSSSPNSSKPGSPVEQTSGSDSGHRDRIHNLLATHDPDKVDKVDAILQRYQGKEEEVIAKLEQRYGLQNTDNVVGQTVEELATPRPTTPPPAPVAAGTQSSTIQTLAAAVPPPVAPPTVVQTQPPVTPAAVAASSPTSIDASPNVDDDATRPTAPPSQRSSSSASDSTSAATTSSDATSPRPEPVEEEEVVETQQLSAPDVAASSSAPAPAVVSVPEQSEAAVTAAPASAPPVVPAPRAVKNFSAAAKVAAAHLEASVQRPVVQRYWSAWHKHHVSAKANALVRDELWVAATGVSRPSQSSNSKERSPSGYQLNDTVQPPYAVADLFGVAAQETSRTAGGGAALSSEGEIAARALLSALRHCVELRVVEVRSADDEALARDFLAHWTVADHLCPVRDTPAFARALHQAAHLIAQLDDLMTVIRTQAGQLQQLKSLHTDVVQRMERAQTGTADADRLLAELESANAHRKELEAELRRLSAHSGATARRPAERRPTSPPRRVFPTIEERKDAQIAKLQQELAKTRNSLFATKEAEEKMRVQVQQATAREARRERDERRREGPPGHHSRPAVSSTRSHSGPAGQRGRPSSGTSSPHRGYPVSATPRGTFSHAIVLNTPRRPSASPGRVEHNGRAVSSIGTTGVDPQDRSNMSLNSNTPWPVSRFAMTAEMERGPCPNCLTPLTSCSNEASGPASAKAAFCFSCRRSFTFGELRARDARDAVDNL